MKLDIELLDHDSNESLFMKIVEHVLRRIVDDSRSSTLQNPKWTLPLAHEFAVLADISEGCSPKRYRQPLLYFMKDLKYLYLASLTIAD